jgi:hypothetical protein
MNGTDLTMRRLTPISLLLAVFLLQAPVARAGDVAAAEALFREGRALMEEGKYAVACPKLAESYEQDPGTGTLLALAMCRERAGQLASAWASYGQVASHSKRDGRADREQAARERMQALEPRLSRLTITVDPETATLPGVAVKRDGAPVRSGAWGTAMPLDPGEHVIEAAAPGRQPWSTKVTIAAERDTQTVRVPALPVAESLPVATSASPAASTPEPAGAPAPKEGPPLRTIGLIVGGAGVVALGVGGLFALKAKNANEESKEDDHCNAANQCDAIGGTKRDDAESAAAVASVSLIAGGVLAAAGITLFVLGAPSREPSTVSIEALPLIGRSDAGVALRGRF